MGVREQIKQAVPTDDQESPTVLRRKRWMRQLAEKQRIEKTRIKKNRLKEKNRRKANRRNK